MRFIETLVYKSKCICFQFSLLPIEFPSMRTISPIPNSIFSRATYNHQKLWSGTWRTMLGPCSGVAIICDNDQLHAFWSPLNMLLECFISILCHPWWPWWSSFTVIIHVGNDPLSADLFLAEVTLFTNVKSYLVLVILCVILFDAWFV